MLAIKFQYQPCKGNSLCNPSHCPSWPWDLAGAHPERPPNPQYVPGYRDSVSQHQLCTIKNIVYGLAPPYMNNWLPKSMTFGSLYILNLDNTAAPTSLFSNGFIFMGEPSVYLPTYMYLLSNPGLPMDRDTYLSSSKLSIYLSYIVLGLNMSTTWEKMLFVAISTLRKVSPTLTD